MSGIYIHIPFCNSKCGYCGFYSIPSLKRKDEFLAAIREEIFLRKEYLSDKHIATIYFGGGTPSLLSVEAIDSLLQQIHELYSVDSDAEVSLEANPDTLSPEYLAGLRSIGVNRLSIGIQSFFDEDLNYLGRRHNSEHARQCLQWAKTTGFDNVSVDLIYGLPTSDADRWRRNLDYFFETGFPHLSAYALTLEPNSILTKQIEMGKALPVNEDDAVRDYELLCSSAREEGFLHYEISNFCKPRHASRHNSAYWSAIPYAGFGPAAHSFDGQSRQWNVASVEKYIEACHDHGKGLFEQESLSPEQRYDEYVMLKLRTMWGIDLKYMKREMGVRFAEYCEQQAQPLIEQGKMCRTREFISLNDEQMLFADGLAEKMFF